MKPLILIMWSVMCITIGVLLLPTCQLLQNTFLTSRAGVEVAPMEAPAHTFDDLLDAIEWVESKGDPWAVGDDGAAVGAYQIHKIYVDDVNRILGYKLFKGEKFYPFDYQDRCKPEKSREMVSIYLNHYGGTFEEMARKHNGGPKGHLKQSTSAYWLKVKSRMESAQ